MEEEDIKQSHSAEHSVINIAFYRFVELRALPELQTYLQDLGEKQGILGSILLSYEGMNGMLAGSSEQIEPFLSFFNDDPRFKGMPVKKTYSNRMPFKRFAVKIKPEIVTMRVQGVEPDIKTGTHLPPEQFRDWLRSDEPMVLVDVRNDYEYEIGTFKGAIDPGTRAFHEFPDVVLNHKKDWQNQKVVMFCTGGIRCEKATSWMLDEGFEDVYQLDGGVLNYFKQIEDAEKDWDGELFIFDGRVALDTNMKETETTLCFGCGDPIVGGDISDHECPNAYKNASHGKI